MELQVFAVALLYDALIFLLCFSAFLLVRRYRGDAPTKGAATVKGPGEFSRRNWRRLEELEELAHCTSEAEAGGAEPAGDAEGGDAEGGDVGGGAAGDAEFVSDIRNVRAAGVDKSGLGGEGGNALFGDGGGAGGRRKPGGGAAGGEAADGRSGGAAGGDAADGRSGGAAASGGAGEADSAPSCWRTLYDDSEVTRFLSRDVQFYLVFLQQCNRWFLAVSVLAIALGVPLNVFGKPNPGETWFDSLTSATLTQDDSWRVWGAASQVLLYSVISYFFIYHFWRRTKVHFFLDFAGSQADGGASSRAGGVAGGGDVGGYAGGGDVGGSAGPGGGNVYGFADGGRAAAANAGDANFVAHCVDSVRRRDGSEAEEAGGTGYSDAVVGGDPRRTSCTSKRSAAIECAADPGGGPADTAAGADSAGYSGHPTTAASASGFAADAAGGGAAVSRRRRAHVPAETPDGAARGLAAGSAPRAAASGAAAMLFDPRLYALQLEGFSSGGETEAELSSHFASLLPRDFAAARIVPDYSSLEKARREMVKAARQFRKALQNAGRPPLGIPLLRWCQRTVRAAERPQLGGHDAGAGGGGGLPADSPESYGRGPASSYDALAPVGGYGAHAEFARAAARGAADAAAGGTASGTAVGGGAGVGGDTFDGLLAFAAEGEGERRTGFLTGSDGGQLNIFYPEDSVGRGAGGRPDGSAHADGGGGGQQTGSGGWWSPAYGGREDRQQVGIDGFADARAASGVGSVSAEAHANDSASYRAFGSFAGARNGGRNGDFSSLAAENAAGAGHRSRLSKELTRRARRVELLSARSKSFAELPATNTGIAFILFRSAGAVNACLEDSRLTAQHVSWRLKRAPSPGDIIWSNVPVGRTARALRKSVLNVLLVLLSIFLTSSAVAANALMPIADVLESAVQREAASLFRLSLTGWGAPFLLFLVNSVCLPQLVSAVAHATGYWRRSAVDAAVLHGNVAFLLLNTVIFPTIGNGSIGAFLARIYDTEVEKWNISIGALILSQSSSFAVRYLLNGCFISSGAQLLQTGQLCYNLARRALRKSRRYDAWEFDFGYHYAFSLSICFMVLAFSVVVPLAAPLGAVYFGAKFAVDQYNIRNGVVKIAHEGGGAVAITALRFLIAAVSFFQFVMSGLLVTIAMRLPVSRDGERRALVLVGTLFFLVSVLTIFIIVGNSLIDVGIHEIRQDGCRLSDDQVAELVKMYTHPLQRETRRGGRTPSDLPFDPREALGFNRITRPSSPLRIDFRERGVGAEDAVV